MIWRCDLVPQYKIYKKDSIAFFTDKMERGSKNDLENYFNI